MSRLLKRLSSLFYVSFIIGIFVLGLIWGCYPIIKDVMKDYPLERLYISIIKGKNYNPKEVDFTYVLNEKEDYIRFTVYEGRYARFKQVYGAEYYNNDYDKYIFDMINDRKQLSYIKPLIEKIQAKTSIRDEQALIAIRLVQSIPYDDSKIVSYGEPERMPYQVLYEEKGICGEKSKLLALLLKELDFDVVVFTNPNHQTVGIKCPEQYSWHDTGYCIIESTDRFPITYVTEKIAFSNTKTTSINPGGKMFNLAEDEYLYARLIS